jgi:uncharacterized protein YjiS (DUF1127 family)
LAFVATPHAQKSCANPALRAKTPICAADHILNRAARVEIYYGALKMEGAMSTMSLEILAVHPRRALRWSQLTHSFAQWRQQARSRAELAMLNDRVLQDIGMSRYTVNFEASKPFWVA